MKLFIAADHAGFHLKEFLKSHGERLGIEFSDLGTHSEESVHYPEYAKKFCEQILATKSEAELLNPCGIIICGSGVGVSIACNRFKKIRAVNAVRIDQAVLSREHNASNVLALGARLSTENEALAIVNAWLGARFEGGRHKVRVDMMG